MLDLKKYRLKLTLPNGTEVFEDRTGCEHVFVSIKGVVIHTIGQKQYDELVKTNTPEPPRYIDRKWDRVNGRVIA